MKKHIPLLACCILLLIIASTVTAKSDILLAQQTDEQPQTQIRQEDSSEVEPTGRVLRPRDRDSQDETVAQTEAADEQAAQNNSQQQQVQARQRILTVHTERLQRRFSFYDERLTAIGEKLQIRLQEMAADGIEVDEAQATLQRAFEALDAAGQNTETAIQAFEEIDPEQYQAQRQMALAARDVALEAHNQYQQALQLMIQAAQTAAQQLQLHNQQQTQN